MEKKLSKIPFTDTPEQAAKLQEVIAANKDDKSHLMKRDRFLRLSSKYTDALI